MQGDETTLKVQDEEKKRTLHTRYLWTIYSPVANRVQFSYASSREGAFAQDLYKGFQGTLQTDCCAGYNSVYEEGTVKRLACMAHIRRKFVEAQACGKKQAIFFLDTIRKLYRIEKELREESTEERRRKRKEQAFPLLHTLYRELQKLNKTLLPKGKLREAVEYALPQSRAMLRYLGDGSFEIDNNKIENSIRPIAIGRKKLSLLRLP